MGRSRSESNGGLHGSDYVGISNEKNGENPFRRKPKVSRARLVLPGLVGPKARPKGVVDGQQVNIPVLGSVRYQRWGDAGG